MAPEGTVTVTLVGVAAVTVARVAPKNTILLAGVVSKLVPDRVTASPGLVRKGVKDVMAGTWAKVESELTTISTKSHKCLRW